MVIGKKTIFSELRRKMCAFMPIIKIYHFAIKIINLSLKPTQNAL